MSDQLATISRPLLLKVLSHASPGMVLVGGQSLSFWSTFYGVKEPAAAVTKDVDFLGESSDVSRIARAISGKAVFPHERALTSLVGQVKLDLADGDYVNVDVMFRVWGDVSSSAIRSRAVVVQVEGAKFAVMHPLDVLQGRLENVYGIESKRDDHSLAQLALGILMIQAFLRASVDEETSPGARPVLLKHINRIETMALSDAGRKVAARHGLHVADAIVPEIVDEPAFHEMRLPQLLPLMSETRRFEIASLTTAPSKPSARGRKPR